MSAQLLDSATISDRMLTLPNWTTDGKALYMTEKFSDFVEAIAFVNQLVSPAEALGHHPDINISYNKVSITMTTHDAGGLTDLDFQLAQTISNLGRNDQRS
ncbi:MAG: 4a-hydroxytetrahydrobiopterin dehydratase [Thermosynechococcaceae cyanobacterium]